MVLQRYADRSCPDHALHLSFQDILVIYTTLVSLS